MLWAVAVCGLLSGSRARAEPAQAATRAEPLWREADAWRRPEGLPQETVFTIVQTRDGYMWVGTRGGLSRFDGVRFTTFDDRRKDQLRENEVWAILEGDDSSLWIGTYGGGLSRLGNGRFTTLTTKDGLVNNFVRQIAKDAEGALWIGTDSGLSRLKDGQFTNFTVQNGLSHNGVRALEADGAGQIWMATKNGVQTVKDRHLEAVMLAEPRPTALIDAVLHDRHGALWLGTQDGLFRWAEGRMTKYTTAEGLSSNIVRRLLEDSQGRLWIATSIGLDRYAGPSSPTPIVNEAPLSNIRSLGEDREGSLWVGYDGQGLARFHKGLFLTYSTGNGLPVDDVRTTIEDQHGTQWIGTAKGLSALRAGTISSYGPANGVPIASVDALALDREGSLWVGTEVGLYRSKERGACSPPSCVPRFVPVANDAIPAMHVRVIYQDRQGAIWAGADLEGLARYQDGRFTTYTTRDGLSNDAVRALVEDRDGGLWIGTKDGLNRFKDGKFTVFDEKDGLPSASIQALYMDPQDTLWIATRHGLSRLKKGRFSNFEPKDGLYSSHVYGFVEDNGGNLWMSCAKGIFSVSKAALNDFADGKIRSVVSVVYGREHGLRSTMASVASYPLGAKSRDGRVWFATRGGLAVVNPGALRTNRVPPPVHMEEVTIDRRAFGLGQLAEAPPGTGDFVFRYTALSFLAPENVRFKYRLEGFDKDWVDAGTRRVAYYTNMPPGRYRFKVIACNNDGVWNSTGAGIDLILAPHLYQTYWFYGICALALALAGAGTQWLRVRHLQKRERELSAHVEEAIDQIKVLSGLLPICASCKKIRDESGEWSQMESYIHEHSEAQFSHGICPDCSEKLYPGVAARIRAREAAKE